VADTGSVGRAQALGSSGDGIAQNLEGSANCAERICQFDGEREVDVADADQQIEGWRGHLRAGSDLYQNVERPNDHRAGPNGSYWFDHEWIICHDGKARRVPRRPEPDICHVVDGVSGEFAECDPSRLLVPAFKGRQQDWKIAGNAIVPQLAAQVLGALMDVLK
jgi:hypothetical protein